MIQSEIHAKLKERFSDAISEYITPKAGDAFIQVQASALYDACNFLRDDTRFAFDFLRLLTPVDYQDRFGMVYHLYSYSKAHEVTLHVDLPKEEAKICSLASLWPTADWFEREAFDMMGIVFEGHPYLKRILLPLDWEGYPLRKDYKEPDEYHGIKNG